MIAWTAIFARIGSRAEGPASDSESLHQATIDPPGLRQPDSAGIAPKPMIALVKMACGWALSSLPHRALFPRLWPILSIALGAAASASQTTKPAVQPRLTEKKHRDPEGSGRSRISHSLACCYSTDGSPSHTARLFPETAQRAFERPMCGRSDRRT